jgi:DNA-directed RNA polymerase subunit RPC12/RpoP
MTLFDLIHNQNYDAISNIFIIHPNGTTNWKCTVCNEWHKTNDIIKGSKVICSNCGSVILLALSI